MNAWQTILLVVIGPAISSVLGNMLYYRWRKRENVPEELHKDIKQLQKDLVAVRGKVLYLEGRMNGKHWRTE